MWRLLFFILLLVASVWLGLEIANHPGYVLLYYKPWMVQMPVWFALVAFILFLGIFYIIIDSIDRLEFLWFRIKNWSRIRKEHKSYSKTQHGLELLIEARWKKAEQLLLAGLNQSYEPLMNYLGAAKAAHEQGAFDRRDEYIQKAYEVAPKAELAIGLTRAEFDLAQDHLEQAMATLTHLQQIAPRHPSVLRLLEKVYVRLGDWKNLEALLPSMRKAKMLTKEQAELFEKNLYSEMFRTANNQNKEELEKTWHDIPRSVRKNPDVICVYVQQLLRVGDTKEASELIRKTLKHEYQAELVRIYGNLPFDNLNKQLVLVNAWLKEYGQQPEILLTLAKLCAQLKLWGKAKDYLDKCLAQGANAEASLEYGKLLENLGDADGAMQKYKAGLS